MQVYCNGFPKHGNHALVKAVELLGLPASVNHRPFADGVPDGVTHHLFIVRDPRNALISWLRFNRKPVTPGMFLAAFRKFQERPLVEEMADYEGWLTDAGAFPIRYESLIREDRTMRLMAHFLDVPYLEGAWEQLPNHTATWNAVHSDYREIWTPEVEAVWNAEGGPELLHRWGY